MILYISTTKYYYYYDITIPICEYNFEYNVYMHIYQYVLLVSFDPKMALDLIVQPMIGIGY